MYVYCAYTCTCTYTVCIRVRISVLKNDTMYIFFDAIRIRVMLTTELVFEVSYVFLMGEYYSHILIDIVAINNINK